MFLQSCEKERKQLGAEEAERKREEQRLKEERREQEEEESLKVGPWYIVLSRVYIFAYSVNT